MPYQATLFDITGVAVDGELFSVKYANDRGIDPATIEPFFDGDFRKTLIGEADLHEILERNRSLWQWEGDMRDLMELWFETESCPNVELIDMVSDLRNKGHLCCVATNNEIHRTNYLRDKVFPGTFDKFYSSSEIGAPKPCKDFFCHISNDLDAPPESLILFDDTPANVVGAREVGIKAFLYTDPDQARSDLRGLGFEV